MEASRPQNRPNVRPHPRIDTTQRSTGAHANRNNTYSWVETPMELHNNRRNVKTHKQETPPIPTIPAAADNSSVATNVQQASAADEYPQDRKSGIQAPYKPSMLDGVHPATFTPYAETVNTSQEQSVYRDNDASSAPTPPKSIPVKESRPAPIHTASDPPDNPRSPNAQPNRTFIPSYHPDAFSGPNSPPLENHIPGQISHPNEQVKGGTWTNGFFDCGSDMGTCCTGLFCPCILYGKTQYRLKLRSDKEDPTNLLGYETVNGSCMAMSVLCGFHWVLAGIQHARVRRIYRLPGGIGSDCAKAICCCWCTLIQDEKEVKHREERARQLAGASKSTPYIAPQGMSYAPPPR